MAAQFCPKCGKPLPAEAQFCPSCGNPVPRAAGPANAAPAAPAPVPPPAPSGPPLGVVLGVQGSNKFLLQHQLFSGGHNYRVLNHEKKHLFTVKENVRQELVSNILNRPSAQPQSGFSFRMGVQAAPTQTYVWTVADSSDVPQAQIAIQVTGNAAVSTLSDSAGTPVVAVSVSKSQIGGLHATAAFPDGRSMFQTHGNLLRHNFTIQDPSGKDVAKIHEAWASVRDTYNLDLMGELDPLCPLIFAILIDREKQAQQGS
jgi:zinc ribbon protein